MPKVSIIIPIFKVEEYLDQCLESVLSQDFIDVEVIGVDDASPDRSVDIFKKYSKCDKRFKLVTHEKNSGLPASRNSGMRVATGDYLYFLDSDDWISPHAISRLYELIQIDSADMAIGGVLKYDEGTSMAMCQNHGRYMGEDFHCRQLFDFPKLASAVTSWNKMISKQFVFNNHLFFSEIPRRFEDMLTYKWYLEGAKVSHTSDITYYYRQRSSENASIMQQMDPSVLIDKILAFTDISKYLIMNGHFLKDYDPIHCPEGIMHLTKALGWILPDLFRDRSIYSKEKNKLLIDGVEATRTLLEVLPAGYVFKLNPRAQKICSLITSQECTEKMYSKLRTAI